MRVTELIRAVEELAPPQHQAPWDRCGVQIASPVGEIRKLALALDPTPDTVRRAVAENADFLLTHHPLLLTPRLPDRVDALREILSLALGADLWLYAAHTSLDVQPEGPVSWLGRELGLADPKVVEVTAVLPASESSPARTLGYGQIGNLPEEISFTAFSARLRALLPHAAMTVSGPAPHSVSRVAVCPGSGSSMARLAASQGAQVLVTGDVKYHAALEACDLGLCLIDPGHYALEEEMVRRLALLLSDRLGADGPEVVFYPGRDPFAPLSQAQPGAPS